MRVKENRILAISALLLLLAMLKLLFPASAETMRAWAEQLQPFFTQLGITA